MFLRFRNAEIPSGTKYLADLMLADLAGEFHRLERGFRPPGEEHGASGITLSKWPRQVKLMEAADGGRRQRVIQDVGQAALLKPRDRVHDRQLTATAAN